MAGLDVRIRTDVLRDPRFVNLSDGAFRAYLSMQMFALDRDRDGDVPVEVVSSGSRLRRMLFVTDKRLRELQEAGLIRIDGDRIQTDWEWQTTAKERREQKKMNRERQQKFRDSQKRDGETTGKTHESNALRDRDSDVTNAIVGQDRIGQDRTGIGQVRIGSRTGEETNLNTNDFAGGFEDFNPPPRERPVF